jgi:hypothetical protein
VLVSCTAFSVSVYGACTVDAVGRCADAAVDHAGRRDAVVTGSCCYSDTVSEEEGGGVRSGPEAARTILLFHIISARPPSRGIDRCNRKRRDKKTAQVFFCDDSSVAD